MNIVLVNPNLYSSKSGGVGQPIGLLSLAGALQEYCKRWKVSIIEANLYDLSVPEVATKIVDDIKPDVVGISVNTPAINYALELATLIKRVSPSCNIIFGGIHATIFADELVKLGCVDAVVKGEGEIAIFQAIINNGVFEKRVEDLNRLAIPAWDNIPISLYRSFLCDDKFAMIMTSRGCPFSCNFCSAHIMCGKKVRYRSIYHIGKELQVLTSLGVKWLLFQDDTFTLNNDHVYDMCYLIDNRFRWWCNARVDVLDFDMIRSMRKAGCQGFCVGVESGNQIILDKMHKNITLEQIVDGVKLIKSAGLKCYAYFMIGNLDDTNETIRETIDFAKSLPLDYAQFNIATPFPATELYEIAQKRGIIGENVDWSQFDYQKGNPPNVSDVSDKERLDWYNRAIREFYLRPRFIIRNLNWKGIKTGWKMIRT